MAVRALILVLMLLAPSLTWAGDARMLFMAASGGPMPEAAHFNNEEYTGWVNRGNVSFQFGTGHDGDGLIRTMTNTEYVSIIKTVIMPRAGSVKFWTKNSFSYDSILSLHVDGVQADTSGQDTAWTQFIIPLTKGEHELEFSTTTTTGYTLWLDEITFQ